MREKKRLSHAIEVSISVAGLVSSLMVSLVAIATLTGFSSELAIAFWAVFVSLLAGGASVYIASAIRTIQRGRVFISCSMGPDTVHFRHKILEHLRKSGVKVWLAEAQIAPGADINQLVRRAIDDADTVVVLAGSYMSPAQMLEINMALVRHVRIIPVLLEDAELPSEISRLRYIDLRTDPEKGLNELVGALT